MISKNTLSAPSALLSLCLTLAAIPALTCLQNQVRAQCVLPQSGLIAWWPAEGMANDIIGGNPGIPMNGQSLSVGSFGPGICGTAFKFDGLDDQVVSASGNLTSVQNSFTIEFWALPASSRTPTQESTVGTPGTSGQRYAIAPEDGGSTGPAGVGVSVGTNGISVFEHAANYLPSLLVYSNTITNWTHVALVYQNKQPNLYVNGVLVRVGLTSPRTSVFPSKTFGNISSYGPFKGFLDEVSIYNRALTSVEIESIYNAGGSGKCKPATPLLSTIIYTNNFEGPVGDEWSASDLGITPVGDRMFLGQFGNQTVTLSLSNLPPHSNLNVSFDLFILQSWDGNRVGPDYWDFGLQGQPSFLHTTFELYVPSGRQSYPGQYPLNDYRSGTGALERNTLGYTFDSTPMDAVYHMVFTFPHTNATAQLQFRGSNLEDISNESWGIDNIQVVADAPTVTLVSPTDGVTLTGPTNVFLSAAPVATSGSIQEVTFLDNNTLLGVVTNAPFALLWSNPPAGWHVLRARATDDSGRTSESSSVLTVNGLLGQYFANTSLAGAPVERRDVTVDFNWAVGAAIPGYVGNIFSAKWTGEIKPIYSETYTFTTDTDDGCRLWIDGQRIIDAWQGQTAPNSTHCGSIYLDASRRHTIQMNYANFACCGAWAHLYWASPSQASQIIPRTQLFPPTPGVTLPPNTPVVNIPAGDDYSVTPNVDMPMSVDIFSRPGPPVPQRAADWEIYTVTPSNLVWYAYGTTAPNVLTNRLSLGVFTNSHAGRSGLLPNMDFVLRVRHLDASAATNPPSNWGLRTFNTRPPGISTQPHITALNRTNPIIAGGSLTLGVTATNILPSVTYQWNFNGYDIPGAANATLALTNVQSGQAGNYVVRVTNLGGTALSQPFTLIVDTGFGTLAQSTFDAGDEGWTVTGGNAPPALVYNPAGGNPGGCIQSTEGTSGAMYWLAPPKFLGNSSGAYGGYLEFDLTQSTTGYPDHGGSVILAGSGLSIFYDAAYNPATTWTAYRVPLDESWWRKGTIAGPAASRMDLLQVLSTLDTLQIRADFSDVSDTASLDNVRLLAPACTPATLLVTHPLPNASMQIEWPDNACGYYLEGTSDPFLLNWITNFPVLGTTVTNGLNYILVPSTNSQMFFRLKQ